MGGTIILWQALSAGQIAAYPEYTGTIGEEILKTRAASFARGTARLHSARFGVGPTERSRIQQYLCIGHAPE